MNASHQAVFIFDIATIEDHGEGLSAFSAALRKNGIPVTPDELKRSKGASKREVTRHFVEQLGANSEQTEKIESTYRCPPLGTGDALRATP